MVNYHLANQPGRFCIIFSVSIPVPLDVFLGDPIDFLYEPETNCQHLPLSPPMSNFLAHPPAALCIILLLLLLFT